jgi:hypothetical protein
LTHKGGLEAQENRNTALAFRRIKDMCELAYNYILCLNGLPERLQGRIFFSRPKTDGGVIGKEKRKSEAETVEVSLVHNTRMI